MPGVSPEYIKKSFPEKIKEEIKFIDTAIATAVGNLTIAGVTLGEKELALIKEEANKLKIDVVDIRKKIASGASTTEAIVGKEADKVEDKVEDAVVTGVWAGKEVVNKVEGDIKTVVEDVKKDLE